jgi:anti-anti-sigma factor
VLSRWAGEQIWEDDATRPQIDVGLDRVSGAVVIRVKREVDIASSPDLEACIRLAATSGRPIVLDLSECSYIDCSVLAVLVRVRRWLGRSFCVVVPHDAPFRVFFTLTGLVEALGVAATLDSAYKVS